MIEDFSAKGYRNNLKEKGVFHTALKLAEIIKDYGLRELGREPKKVYDPTCGFRVIIVIEANSYVNIRGLELLPKFKTQKIKSPCAA